MRQRLVAARLVAGKMEPRRDMAATEASHNTLLNSAESSWCDGRSRCDRLERSRWWNGGWHQSRLEFAGTGRGTASSSANCCDEGLLRRGCELGFRWLAL